MKLYQQKVVNEQDALIARIEKLKAFIANPVFKAQPVVERELLTRQYNVMNQYSAILQERIASFDL